MIKTYLTFVLALTTACAQLERPITDAGLPDAEVGDDRDHDDDCELPAPTPPPPAPTPAPAAPECALDRDCLPQDVCRFAKCVPWCDDDGDCAVFGPYAWCSAGECRAN